MAYSRTTFKTGHPPLNKNLWSKEELLILANKYPCSSPEEILSLLPKRKIHSIYAMALRLNIAKDKTISIINQGKGLLTYYQEHPEAKEHLRVNGLKLLKSPHHHRRKPGEYSLPCHSRIKISQTLKKKFREDSTFRNSCLSGLAKARAICLLRKTTIPELKVRNILETLGVHFIQEYKVGAYYIDFILPDKRIALLVDGCYWHCCPIHFPIPKYKEQQHNLIIDHRRDAVLIKQGWQPLHIWECKISMLEVKLGENTLN
jgi:DNA mismatch endonuclease (patch repair protein)